MSKCFKIIFFFVVIISISGQSSFANPTIQFGPNVPVPDPVTGRTTLLPEEDVNPKNILANMAKSNQSYVYNCTWSEFALDRVAQMKQRRKVIIDSTPCVGVEGAKIIFRKSRDKTKVEVKCEYPSVVKEAPSVCHSENIIWASINNRVLPTGVKPLFCLYEGLKVTR